MHKSSGSSNSLKFSIESKDNSEFHRLSNSSGKKICISGGKGVGKTSIALKTALEFSSAGYKVLLIDCDSENSNILNKLNLKNKNNFSKILSGELSFHEYIIKNDKFHILTTLNDSCPVINSKLNMNEIIIDIISSHEHEYDFIFIDLPAGFSIQNLALNAYCDHRWIIVTPDKSSITDSYSLIKLLAQNFDITKNHLIINKFQNERQFQKLVITLTETVENFIGAETLILGGIEKLDLKHEEIDTFFLSETKNEFQKNFVKLLYGFTEEAGGPLRNHSKSASQMAFEQDVQ